VLSRIGAYAYFCFIGRQSRRNQLNYTPSQPDRIDRRPTARESPISAPAAQPGGEPVSIDLRHIFLTVWRVKWVIVISTLIAAILGVLTVSQVGPVYSAAAKVMFGSQRSTVTNMQNVLVDQTFDNTTLQDQMEILRSTVLTERVIDELKLDQNPRFNPSLRVAVPSLVDRLRGVVSLPPEINDFFDTAGIGAAPLPAPDPEELERRIRLAVIGNVLARLRLVPVGQSRVIAITYVSDSPTLAAAIANSYANQYIVDQLEAKLELTSAATTWLTARVEEMRVRVRETADAVEAARLELNGDSGQSLEVTQQQLQALNASLSTITGERSRLESLHERLNTAIDQNMDLGTISEFRSSGVIAGYRMQETDISSKRINLESSVSPTHPSLKRLDLQLSEVRRNIVEEAGRIVSAAYLDLLAARSQEVALISEVRELEQQAFRETGNEAEIRQLEREADAASSLYNSFLTRLQETTAQQDLQEADARLLSPAEVPLYPLSVAKRRTLAVFILLGLVAGTALAFLLDRLNNTFRSPAQLEEMMGQPLLGVLPSLGARMRRKQVIRYMREKPGSSMVEEVRNLRTSILFSNIDNPPQVVMFTSSVPREGKSTTSMLVAMTSCQMGKSTIIVDCDLRLPALAGLLEGDDRAHGLMSVLEGTSTIEEAVEKDPTTGLHMLTTAEKTGGLNAADILSSRRFGKLVEDLSKKYDLVILDTPPSLVVADARIISRVADAVVYCVRYDSTPRNIVADGLKELRLMNAPLVGVVMTLVNESRASNYSYAGHSYHKGRYSEYYTT